MSMKLERPLALSVMLSFCLALMGCAGDQECEDRSCPSATDVAGSTFFITGQCISAKNLASPHVEVGRDAWELDRVDPSEAVAMPNWNCKWTWAFSPDLDTERQAEISRQLIAIQGGRT